VSLNNDVPPIKAPGSSRLDRLIETLLDELLAWNPREFIAAFRRWHRDAFSLIHLNVLTILEMDGSISMSQLAASLDVSVASMTGIVDRMEERGLVERRRDLADRRIVLVDPTEAGRDVFREIDRRRREGLLKMLAQLGDQELAGLLTGHRALRAARAAALIETARTDEATSATPATTSPPTPSAATGSPPDLHQPSTIAPDDPPVKTTTGSRR
jgi:DNA-binding MarR family transcriptional regulator